MVLQALQHDKGILRRLKDTFSGLSQCEELDIEGAYRLENKKVRLPLKNYPIQLNVGSDENILHICPEHQINDGTTRYPYRPIILFLIRPVTIKEISGFLRLNSGDKLIIGGDQDDQKFYLNLEQGIADRHLSITNDNGSLVFKNL